MGWDLKTFLSDVDLLRKEREQLHHAWVQTLAATSCHEERIKTLSQWFSPFLFVVELGTLRTILLTWNYTAYSTRIFLLLCFLFIWGALLNMWVECTPQLWVQCKEYFEYSLQQYVQWKEWWHLTFHDYMPSLILLPEANTLVYCGDTLPAPHCIINDTILFPLRW